MVILLQMLETTRQLITKTASGLGLSDQVVAKLLKVDKIHEFEIKLASGKKFKAYRSQHNNQLGPYKGGIRFHPEVSVEEVEALSILMSFKCAAIGLPLGGGKGGITVNPKDLSIEEIEELSRAYVAHLHPHIGPDQDVPAPDVNTNSQIIDWMVDEYAKQTKTQTVASFTGKSQAKGGSQGRTAATGYGGVVALNRYLELEGKQDDEITVAIQGFGNVGQYFALRRNDNWKITAVSDSSATIENPDGLDVEKIIKFKNDKKSFKDYQESGVQIKDGSQVLSADVDVLVPAALGNAITEKNVGEVKAKIILELANGPITDKAYDELDARKVAIIPDIVANAGGVIVSYLEWQQNLKDDMWSEQKVEGSLKKYMEDAVEVIYKSAKTDNINLKEAGLRVGIKKFTS